MQLVFPWNFGQGTGLQAAGLARAAIKATGKVAKIAGSLPPLNGSFRPDRVRSVEEIEPLYREQAEILAPHVDVFLCETMSHINEAIAAARAARSTGKPVIVSFTLHEQNPGKLRSGQSLEDAINGLGEVDLEGHCANCTLPERIFDAMPILAKSGLKYVEGYANAFTHVPEDWLLDGGENNRRTASAKRRSIARNILKVRWPMDQSGRYSGRRLLRYAAHSHSRYRNKSSVSIAILGR